MGAALLFGVVKEICLLAFCDIEMLLNSLDHAFSILTDSQDGPVFLTWQDSGIVCPPLVLLKTLGAMCYVKPIRETQNNVSEGQLISFG